MVTKEELRIKRRGIAGRAYRRRIPPPVAVAPTPQHLAEQERAKIETERKQELEKGIKNIDKDLKVYQQRVTSIERQLRKPNLTSEKKNKLEDDMAEASRNIKELGNAKKLIQQGYTESSVRAYAEARALGFQEKRLAKKEVVKFKGEPLVAWREPSGKIRYQSIAPDVAKREGLTPIVVGYTGKGVMGFEELPRYKAEFEPVKEVAREPSILEVPSILRAPSVIEPYTLKTRLKMEVLVPKERAEQWIRKEVTYPLFKKTGITVPKVEKVVREISILKITTPVGIPTITPPLFKPTPFMVKKAEYEAGFVGAAVRRVKEKPVTTALWFGAGVVTPPAVAGVGWLGRATKIAPLVSKIPIVPRVTRVGVTYGLPVLYGVVKGKEIYAAPTPRERGRVIGEAVVGEIAPLVAGSLFGAKFASRIASKELIAEQTKELSEPKKVKFKKYMEEILKLEETGHPPVKEVSLEGMKRIPSRAKKPTMEFLKKATGKGDILGGSIAGRTQTYGIKRSYAESDLDLYTKVSPSQRALEYAKALRGAGVERVSTVSGTGRVTIAGKKVAEWHSMEAYTQNIYQAEGFFKPVAKTVTKTPKGIRVMKIETQAKRKLIASYLQGRYGKDYPDFKGILKSMEKTAEIQAGVKVEKIKPEIPPKKIPPPRYKYPDSYKYPALYKPYPFITPVSYPYPAVKKAIITPYPLDLKAPTPYFKPSKITPTYKPLIEKPPISIPVPTPPYPTVPTLVPTPPYEPPIPKPPVITPTPPTPPPVTILGIKEPKIVKKVIVKRRKGWDVYGKVVKTKKYVKLNIEPLTQKQAQNLGSYLTDRSLATNWELRQSDKLTKKPKLKAPSGYYIKTKKKWREYRIKKGKRIPTPHHYIEKRGKPRLDTREEIKKITLLKKLAELKQRSLAKALEKRRRIPSIKPTKRLIIKLSQSWVKPKKMKRGKKIKW